jgi:hypothetical protein
MPPPSKTLLTVPLMMAVLSVTRLTSVEAPEGSTKLTVLPASSWKWLKELKALRPYTELVVISLKPAPSAG